MASGSGLGLVETTRHSSRTPAFRQNQGNHHDLISSLVACIIAVMAARMGVGSSGQALTTSVNAGSSALLVSSGKWDGKTLCCVDATPWSANDLRDWRIGLRNRGLQVRILPGVLGVAEEKGRPV